MHKNKNFRDIFQDWDANNRNLTARFVLLWFRTIQVFLHSRWSLSLAYLLWLPFKIFTKVFLHLEISPHCSIGAMLSLPHPFCIVVNRFSTIGPNCIIRHCTTIGNKGDIETAHDCPVIGANVKIGCNSVILGPIKIGDCAVIAASSIVVKNVAPGSTYIKR